MTKDELSLMVVTVLEGILAGIEADEYSSQELGDLYMKMKGAVDDCATERLYKDISELCEKEAE